jgi:hypothetical protein
MKTRIVFLLVCIALACLPATAHHSLAQFDLNRTVSFTGVVTGIYWANPHVVLLIKTTDASGKPETWALQGMALNAMNRFSSADKFKEGMTVAATGHPARSNSQYTHPGVKADTVKGILEALELRLPGGEVLPFSRFTDRPAATSGLR